MSYAIRDKGGNLICIAELDSSNAVSGTITNGTNALNCGLVKESQVDIDPTIEKFKAEDGKTYGQDEEFDGTVKGTLMETDKTKADYLAFGVRDKNSFVLYKYEGIKNGKHQEVFAVGDVTPQLHFKTPGGVSAQRFEFQAVPPATAVTFSTGALAALGAAWGKTVKTTSAVTVPAGQEFVIVETAVS